MKTFVLLNLLCLNSFAATTVKFVSKTDGPGITVEGEVLNPKVMINFNKLEATTFSFDAMDLDTGMDARTTHLRKKVFSATARGMAKIDFTTTKVVCPEPSKPEMQCAVTGNLKIKNESNEVTFNAIVNKVNQTAQGTTAISLTKFKLPLPSFMGVTVLDNVDITFNVSAK